jgi:hypothetical protein
MSKNTAMKPGILGWGAVAIGTSFLSRPFLALRIAMRGSDAALVPQGRLYCTRKCVGVLRLHLRIKSGRCRH